MSVGELLELGVGGRWQLWLWSPGWIPGGLWDWHPGAAVPEAFPALLQVFPGRNWAAQEGVGAHGFGLGQWQSVHGTPKIPPKSSALHLSIQMQLWLSAVLRICLGHHQGMFFQGMIVRNSFPSLKIHHRFNFFPVYPFNTQKELSEWLIEDFVGVLSALVRRIGANLSFCFMFSSLASLEHIGSLVGR